MCRRPCNCGGLRALGTNFSRTIIKCSKYKRNSVDESMTNSTSIQSPSWYVNVSSELRMLLQDASEWAVG